MGPEQQIANLSEELLKDGSCFDEAVQAADLLATQLAVQSEFNKTAAILRNSPADATLPNRERLSVFLKFLCEETPQNPKRDRLRTLHIDAKIFCAECYPVSRLMTLPKAQFDFIIKKVSIYIKLHGLAPYLYRQDLNTRFTNFEHSVGASGYNEYLEGLAKAHCERRSSVHRANINRESDIDRESTQTGEPESSPQRPLSLDDLKDIVNSGKIAKPCFKRVKEKAFAVTFFMSPSLGKTYENRKDDSEPLNDGARISVISATEA